MKVYDVLTESKQVDEGPIRFLKRTLGKNTAMGKAAQLDVELDKEVSDIYKDFVAVSKQDPKMGGMTAKGLANFLKAKGFVSKPSDVMSYVNQEPSLGRKASKAGKKVAKGAKAAAGAAKSGASKVGQAASKLKKKLSPEPTGLTPDQPNLPGIESMYSEARLMEVDVKLSGGQAKKIIKRFVQQGFQKQMGNRLSKSSYGDAPADTAKGSSSNTASASSSKSDAKAMATPTMDVASAIKFLRSQGYTVTAPKKQKQKA
tara:strand:+ start:142 stop:918 length:777 start_codon:yes stop_codon:yes gene_type:complete